MKYFMIIPILCFSMVLLAQDPVSWSTELKTDDDKTYAILKADVQNGWYIYSQKTDPDGPVPTEIIFAEDNNYALDGAVTEHGDVIKKYDDLFEVDVMKYKDEVEFKQAIAFKSESDVKVEVTYMVCDSEKCLPPKTIELTISQ